ncbi:hypothetical protein SISSUDRAFT_1065163 [Sistotremastrum suecicum HHB10207 ss-3]|uniref:Uncharacterized protein n=1 Tax=Sistotremastrum suecicum HHB10207 ss-3 TaxID=1314776 RepID=A0A165ZT38_9AGAM|nr:hypothetical protein SISSUDRAFT_1065163 [Sistotremastrum suecicum HHB10207 ss-3]
MTIPGSCYANNAPLTDPNSYPKTIIDSDQVHVIGWIVAGLGALLSLTIASKDTSHHARHNKKILSITFIPFVVALVSFLSYLFFRYSVYFSLVQVVYESFTFVAFFRLFSGHEYSKLYQSPSSRLAMPLCCFGNSPSEETFYIFVWQYAIVGPLIVIAGIVTNVLGVYCPGDALNPHFAHLYLEAIKLLNGYLASNALSAYRARVVDGQHLGLKFFVLQSLTFYITCEHQFFVVLARLGVIKATPFWTRDNIVSGLSSLVFCIEMPILSIVMRFAFPVDETYIYS